MRRTCVAWEGGSEREGGLGATGKGETQMSEHPLFTPM